MTRRIALLIGACLCLGTIARAEDASMPPGWDPSRFMSVRELRPGMKAVGRSVFQGTKVEDFQVEILGVVDTPSPRGTMIMAELSGHDLEKLGVVAGMSGSPIFVDGKLIGALAFGWSFSSRPVAGITPIEEMLRLEARPAASPNLAEAKSGGLPIEEWQSLMKASGARPSSAECSPAPARRRNARPSAPLPSAAGW
jgi:hypothetical protein